MAEGLNKVMLIGNLGQDPELRYTQKGQAILNMRLATSESFLNRDNERQERTEWHTVILWGKRAEALNKILAKGRQIYIEGRLQTRKWEDKEGKPRYTTEVVANNVILVGGRGGGGAGQDFGPPPADDYGPTGHDANGNDGGGGNGDDIPF
jgi:single-strand DNA-binding protein